MCVSTHRSLTKRWRCCFMQITFSKHYHQCHINNVVVSLGSKGFQTKTSPGLCVSNRFIFVRCWFDSLWFDQIFCFFFYPQKRSILSKRTNVQFWWYSNGNQLQFLIWLMSKKKKKPERTFFRTWFHRFPTWLSNTEKEFCQNGSLFGTFWPRNLWVFRFLCFFHAWLKSVKWNEL